MGLLSAGLLAFAWILLVPEPVLAWGPGTHVALGEMVLSALYLLPPAVRALLARHPIPFLYGSIAADISFAKKYAPEGRHCHNWHVGEEILAAADTEALQAVGYGYLAHLAADTVAHNLFVPRRLLLTSTTQAMGHTYWEHRMDVHVGEEFLGKARRVVMDNDHSSADALFDSVLSRTIFSFGTNRRIFRGMIRFQGDERWMQVFEKVLQKSRFDLPDALVDRYMALSFDYVIDYLANRHLSSPFRLDPVGDLSLRLAKKVRRLALADRGAWDASVLDAMADDFFPFPDAPLAFWPLRERNGLDPGPPARDPGADPHAPKLDVPFTGPSPSPGPRNG
ncbi:MAG TPA: zinc dependent phospholipase C family protein [Longimicrobiales bacterium]